MSGFVGAGDNVLLYEWDFGDGTFGTGKNVVHTYTAVGDYDVALTSTYADGGVYHDHATVSIAGEPDASFTAREFDFLGSFLPWRSQEGVLTWRFDGRGVYPKDTGDSKYRAVQLVWDFGDGEVKIVSLDEENPLAGMFRDPKTCDHRYAAAGIYTVTLTLTDNLGYTDTTAQTITVGTPEDEDDDTVETGDFTLGAITWIPGDDEEEEEDCVFIEGTVQNDASVAAGAELTATAYDATGAPVGTFTYWPAGATNIGVGINYAFGFFLCDLSISADQVVTVEVVISATAVY
jgi:PKD repeat protein